MRASWRCVGSLRMHALRVCIVPEARCRTTGAIFYGMTHCGQKWTIRTQRRKTLKKLLTKHQRTHLLFSRRRCNAEWSRGGSHASRNELFFVGGSTYKLTVRVLHIPILSRVTHSHRARSDRTLDIRQPRLPIPTTQTTAMHSGGKGGGSEGAGGEGAREGDDMREGCALAIERCQ